jgi:hypothetical protein
MIVTSMIAMFALTYLSSEQIVDHARFSETRLFMTLIMGCSMTCIMLVFMLDMYRKRLANAAILAGASVVMAIVIWLVRSQTSVDDVDYMEGMIPHHSIAILTSERARIEDPRVRDLAERILAAQRSEIREMEWLIADIRSHGVARSPADAERRPVPGPEERPSS